jgi:hypothetical protein
MQGWRVIARIVDSVYAAIPDKELTLIRADNYGQAGAINFYTKYAALQALSYNADYIYWFPAKKRWNNLILIKDGTDTDKNREHEKHLFDTIYLAGQVQNKFAREKGTSVYALLGAGPTVNEIITAEIAERKIFTW